MSVEGDRHVLDPVEGQGEVIRGAPVDRIAAPHRVGQAVPQVVGRRRPGFIGPDRPSPPEAVAIAAERGVDLSGHRSQVVTAEILRDADLVLVMNRAQ